MRIGSRAEIEPEYETHIRMLQMGFPVPEVLDCGEWEGRFYWVEESVGARENEALDTASPERQR